MTSKIYRTAGSIKNGTVAAASYAGSTLAYVAPQMAGAIDIMVVSQPDGSLRSSPFYVRFGKYTGLRTADKKVQLVINDVQADFTMHLGRSGEAYFVGEDDIVGDSDEEGELLAGMMSPPTGYSSADEALSYATPQQTASIQAAVAKLGHLPGLDIQAAADKQAASQAPALRPSYSSSTVTDILSVPASLDTSLSAPPGDPTLTPLQKQSPRKSKLNPARSLDKPPLAPKALLTDEPLTPLGLGSPTTPVTPTRMGIPSPKSEIGFWDRQDASYAKHADMLDVRAQHGSSSVHPARSHLTTDLAAVKQQEEERRASNAQAESSSSPAKAVAASQSARQSRLAHGASGSSMAANGQKASVKGSSPSEAKGQKATAAGSTPFELASQKFLQEQGPVSTTSNFHSSTSHTAGKASAKHAQHAEEELEPIAGSCSEAEDRLIHTLEALRHSKGGPDASNPQDFTFQTPSEAPIHPWSVSNPRFLATPTASQPPTLTMHASVAAAPVGSGSASASAIPPAQHMAMSQPSPEANTAIPAAAPSPEASEDGLPHAGNRVELEAIHDQLYRKHQTAQMAMLNAHKERVEWDHEGGPPPVHSHYGQEVAVSGDLAAAQAANSSADPHSDGSSSSSASHQDLWDSQSPAHTHAQKSPFSAHHALRSVGDGNTEFPLKGAAPRTPMSPQPSRPPRPALTRQLSKSAPSSPHHLLNGPLHAPEAHASSPASDANSQANGYANGHANGHASGYANGHTNDGSEPLGSIRIPGRGGQMGLSNQAAGSVAGSVRGSEGGLNGLSPPDGYMADSELASSRHRLQHSSVSFNSSGRLVGAGSLGAGHVADAWASLAGFKISLCGDHLSPSISPEEVYQAFQAHRVSEAEFAEQGSLLIHRPNLMCRLADKVFPWHQAAPVVMGVLAFGGDWQSLLPAEGGVPIAVPVLDSQASQQSARKAQVAKSSSWRVWLGSWRSGGGGTGRNGKPGSGSLDAAVAAAAAATDPRSPAAQQLALEALESGLSPQAASMVNELVASQQGQPPPGRRRAFVPSPAQLKALPLQYGQNTIDFTFAGQRLRAYIHYFNWNSRLVISDIDGTITKSDLLGHLLPRVGFDWSHRGVTRLFTNIKANGYVFMFLSSRAIAQASATRDYLHTLNQDGETLPAGPVIISPDGLFPSLYRELVLRRPHEFKIRCLEDIRALFPADWNPFYAGFGNRDTDEISYLTVGVPASKCFIINPKGELRKASSAVATSTWGSLTSVNTIVQAMFPSLQQEAPHATPEREEYNDYNYWHVTPPIIIDSEDDAFGDPEGQQSESDSDEDIYHHFL